MASTNNGDLTPEEAALIGAGLPQIRNFKRLEELIAEYSAKDGQSAKIWVAGFKNVLDRAKKNLACITRELEAPSEFRSDDVKFTDSKAAKLERKGVLKFLEREKSYRQQALQLEEYISPWLLKSAFTAEEASILIAGLESFDSLSQVEELIAIATETAPDNSIFTEKNIERYQTQLENAFTIKEALVKELALELSSESSLQPATHDKSLITKVSIYSWCKSQGIDLQYWHQVFPSEREHNEPEKLSSNEAPDKVTNGLENGITQESLYDARSCLNPSHPHYSKELAAAVTCWNNLFLVNEFDETKGTKKQQAKDWYFANRKDLITLNRKENKNQLDRLTTIINSDKFQ